MSEKFNFTPLEKKKKIEVESYVKILTTGALYFSQATLYNLGLCDEPFFIKLYCDTEKRALGFKLLKVSKLPNNSSLRYVKPHKLKTGAVNAVISIKTFVETLGKTELPTDRLYLKKYKGSYLDDELFYVIVPSKRKKSEISERSIN